MQGPQCVAMLRHVQTQGFAQARRVATSGPELARLTFVLWLALPLPLQEVGAF